MKPYFAMGLFAFYVATVFLTRMMAEREYFRTAAMKRIWGRTRGLAIHFLANVALPVVLGIIFLCRGIADFSSGEVRLFAPLHHRAALAHLHLRPAGEPVFVGPGESIRTGEIPILLASLPARPQPASRHPECLAWDFVPEPTLPR